MTLAPKTGRSASPRRCLPGTRRWPIGALAALAVLRASLSWAATYYVDSAGGSDSRSGTATNAAWQSLANVNATAFAPGDVILFKAGGRWTGTLHPLGSGTSGAPIVIDRYGGGDKPVIDGNAAADAVYLSSQAFWEINNLEVVNDAASDAERRGIHIAAEDCGTVNHIYVRNCFVHNIRGRLSTSDGDLVAKRTGGIVVEVTGDSSVPTRFNDVRIEGNVVRTVRNEGIVAAGNRSGNSDAPGSDSWLARKVTNLLIRGNTISDVAKNALILRLADASCLVEGNVCFDTATLDTGNTMFTASCDGAVFQFNEGYRNHAGPDGDHDGSLYDADVRSFNIVFQYSYSHDNAHGLFWQYNHGSDTNIVVRYNISRNDRGSIFAFSGSGSGRPTAHVYNNTVYLPGTNGAQNIVDDRSTGHTYRFSNNVFLNLNPDAKWNFTSGNARTFDSNTFYGQHPASEPSDAHKLTSNPRMVAPGSGGTGLNTLGGYQLQAGSPCIDSGATIADSGGHDFYGNAVPQRGVADRGAHEFAGAETNSPHAGSGPVIAEFYCGGGKTGAAYSRDYVVVKNAAGTAVSVANWSLQHCKAGVWQAPVALPASALPPGGFLLVQCYYDGGTARGAALAPDVTAPQSSAWNLNMVSAGAVALVNATGVVASCASTNIVDLVGFYSTAGNCYEGLDVAPAGSAAQSSHRRSSGCQDTGENAEDFALGAPTPLSSADPADPCAAIPSSLRLADLSLATGGQSRFSLTNTPGLRLTVVCESNLFTPADEWTALGTATETGPGRYEFEDAGSRTNRQRYYRLRWP